MMGLTRRQRELLIFLRAHMQRHGIAPSHDEMRKALGTRSVGRVQELVAALEERGFIKRMPHRARAIEILKTADNHASDCSCGDCVHARYLDLLKFTQALKIEPPVALVARGTNFFALSVSTRNSLLGIEGRGPAPRTRKAVAPRDGAR